MAETKFTPGPWEVVNGTDVFTGLGATNAAGVKADYTDGWHLADCSVGLTTVDGQCIELSRQEQMANAHLMAAARDGFEAAETAYIAMLQCQVYEQRMIQQVAMIKLREFLAKALNLEGRDVAIMYEAKARGEHS